MPRNASAIPAEQITMYFHEASSAPLVRRWPTRNVVVIVVASTATHITPRLAGQDRDQHADDERLDQRRVQCGRGEGCRHPGWPRQTGSRADWQEAKRGDRPDHQDHEGAERVRVQHAARRCQRRMPRDPDGEHRSP